MPTIDFSSILTATVTTRNSGVRTANIPNGRTIILPVRDPRISIEDIDNMRGVGAKATDYYKGKQLQKTVVLGVVLHADDPQYLPRGWDGDWSNASAENQERAAALGAKRLVVSFALNSGTNKSLAYLYLQRFVRKDDDLFTRISAPCEVDAETGKLHFDPAVNFPLVVLRSGKEKSTTYDVSVGDVTPQMQQFIASKLDVVLLPSLTLPEIGVDFSEYAKRRHDESSAPAAAPAATDAPKPASSTDFLSAMGF
jgi:hypothetical protein